MPVAKKEDTWLAPTKASRLTYHLAHSRNIRKREHKREKIVKHASKLFAHIRSNSIGTRTPFTGSTSNPSSSKVVKPSK